MAPSPVAPPTPSTTATAEARPTWGHRGLALLTGLLYALSHPTVWPGKLDDVHASLTRPSWILAFVCLVPGLWVVRRMSPWRAYIFSMWMFVPGTFLILYWLMIAMNVFGRIPLVASAALLVLLSFVGWNFMATAVGVARWMEVHWKWPSALAVPLCWAGMETWRAHVYFGGFPWGNLGTTQFNNLPILQLGSLGGVYLIILLIMLVNVALLEVVRAIKGERAFPKQLLAVAAASVVLSTGYGTWRVSAVDAEAAAAPKVEVGMLQGNIEQGIKNQDYQHKDFIIGRYEALQQDALARGAELIVWPEAAYPVPFDKRGDESLRGYRFPSLGRAAGIIGAVVFWREAPELSGPECQTRPRPAGCNGRPFTHNSALLVGADGKFSGRFDKSHLVPFGEYVPWPLGPVAKAVVPMLGTTVPGEKLTPLPLPLDEKPAQVGTLICYEGIFPQHATDFVRSGAELLVNVTNDAWYGISSASVQHLAFYAMRAAEHGRAVARAANTGITAGIDPAGRIINPSQLYDTVAVVTDLPVMRSRTLYSYTGDLIGWACALVFTLALGRGLKGWYGDRRARKAA